MFDENITFYNKYFKRAHFEQFIYNVFNMMALKVLYKKKINSILRKIYFKWYYSPFKAFLFSIDYYTIGKNKYKYFVAKEGWDFSSRDWIYGANIKWDVPDELYKGDQRRNYYYRDWSKSGNIH
jgi:hypothetical protein